MISHRRIQRYCGAETCEHDEVTKILRPLPLQAGDEVRVVAPSRSLAIVSQENRAYAEERVRQLGLKLTFGNNVEQMDNFGSSSIESRVADIHDAFADPDVRGILTVLGGYNANQLLPYLDWDLIASNPKIICGFSDITALSCAIHAKTGLITFSGPHFTTFAMREHFEQTMEFFGSAVMSEHPIELKAANTWSDDTWHLNQAQRRIIANEGFWVMAEGDAEGRLVGGNLCTLNLLQGTEYMPDLKDTILFVEDDAESMPHTFDRDLSSLCQQPSFREVKGILIGRFQTATGMTRSTLEAIVRSKAELRGIPIVANMDFGHTDPIATLPIGERAIVKAGAGVAAVHVRP